jgi:hypothetical protein
MTQDSLVKFYVNKKELLFPLMLKYGKADPKKMNHGQAAGMYIQLLRSSEPFRVEVLSAMQSAGYRNMSAVDEAIANNEVDIAPAKSIIGGGGILGGIANIIGGVTQTQAAKAQQDTLLYNAVLKSQGGSDTTKILIISGVALVFVIVGTILVVKMKKS